MISELSEMLIYKGRLATKSVYYGSIYSGDALWSNTTKRLNHEWGEGIREGFSGKFMVMLSLKAKYYLVEYS